MKTPNAVSTSGIKESSIKSFGDVINNNYKVVVVDGSTEHEILKASHPGTAMHRVYYNTMAEDTNAIVQSYEMAANAVYSRKKTLFFGNSLVSIAYDGLKSLEIKVIFYHCQLLYSILQSKNMDVLRLQSML